MVWWVLVGGVVWWVLGCVVWWVPGVESYWLVKGAGHNGAFSMQRATPAHMHRRCSWLLGLGQLRRRSTPCHVSILAHPQCNCQPLPHTRGPPHLCIAALLKPHAPTLCW